MKFLFFCPRWGHEHIEWDVFLNKVKNAGYNGIECGLSLNPDERMEVIALLKKYELMFIAQHWQTVVPDFTRHCQEYEQQLRWLASTRPLFINSQTGKDYYSFEKNKFLIEIAAKIVTDTGVEVIHETHRGKFSFAAHVTREYLEKIPELVLTLDISHWCNTAESFLHDQQDAVDLAISRTRHIHARVGYTEGPQITDPRAPEWKTAVDFHLQCWDRVVANRISMKAEFITITPEFGAPPYLPVFPYTQQPIVSQWDINTYMMQLLRERYS
jgi:sugar phosphate isomerase/epimerase